MTDFTVDIGGLDALGKNLDRTIENVENATKRMKDIGPDSIGPKQLDEALADFRADWEEGLEQLREAVSEIRDGLDQAKKAYAEVESDLRESLSKMADNLEAAETQNS
ncbi:type VII secretion target [Saccharomonospora sp.]|uniref:type VII secretion target n=1 Tax=Saccharomonospora sp. TaxID=33913 RepID=UPI002636A217|nr:type VII secretion target [Saccharomonospora sp.]